MRHVWVVEVWHKGQWKADSVRYTRKEIRLHLIESRKQFPELEFRITKYEAVR